jgi:hypothetical protein
MAKKEVPETEAHRRTRVRRVSRQIDRHLKREAEQLASHASRSEGILDRGPV